MANENGNGDQVNVEQLLAERDSYKGLVDQQQAELEKNKSLIQTLRKIESRAERSESILKDALGAVTIGVPQEFLKTVETLPIETKWQILKAYPRQMSDAPQAPQTPQGQQQAPQSPQGQQPPAQAQGQQQAPQQQQQQQQAPQGRPAVPPMESPFDREKRELQANGQLNMHTLQALIMKHAT